MSESRTLLLVEDEAIVAEDEAKQLRDEGYRVIVVGTGEKAIETIRARADEIQLVLMDVDLGNGGMDGPEAAREILKDHDVPILFLSSHTEKRYVEKTADIFSYGYTVKDSGITILQASVNMAFKLHEAHLKRRQAEEKLRASELFNFALFQYNPIQTVIVDRDGRVVKANLAKRQSGDRIPRIGDLMYRDYAGKHTIDMRGELMACMASGKPVQFPEIPYDDKVLHISIAPFSEGAIITSQDITARVRAMERVRLSEQRLALAQKAAGAGVWNWDTVSKRLIMSPELYAIFGRAPDDPEDPAQIWQKSIHPNDAKAARLHLEAAIANKNPVEDEFRIVRPNGQVRWLRLMGNTVYDASGKPVRMDGICLDITDYKFRENVRAAVYEISEVAQQAETLEDIFKALHKIVSTLIPAENFYIALFDPEKKILSFPYFVDEYDEQPPPQPIGRGLTEYVLFRGEPLHATSQKSEELKKAGEIVLIGAPSADWLGVPLKIHGQTIGVMAVQTYVAGASYTGEDQDILSFVSGQAALSIERKQSEAALQRLVKQKEILMRELQHRTKNSLALISSLLGLEKENLTDARSREIFSKTRSRIGSIATVYERLSDSINYDSVDLHVYVREIAEAILRSFAPEAGNVRLKTKLEETRLDPKRAVPVGLILTELIMNSLKYGFPGKAMGEIRLELKKSDGRIFLDVADNGTGVSKDFDFNNATGTGLTIVRMLAEQLDAELNFSVDHGTRVQLSFNL
ncbi:MAG: PAS domain-containing protein [Candidatus Aminicenantes bacterium]|nr:PAS domain-containing protein [Candidatus Aminicenantes bacterium]